MRALIDTTVWSHVLRRKFRPEDAATHVEVVSLIKERRVAIIGPVRQEVLSGIKERAQFARIRGYLRAFVETPISIEDYEEAAMLFNRCRENGIQGSHTDFLICAIALRHNFSIFTTDNDFVHFATVLPIVLHVGGQ